MMSDGGSFALEVGYFPVQHLTFGSETGYHGNVLTIDRTELLAAIAEPRVIADIELHLAHPGESCRIVHVLDAVAPMVKISGRSTAYPGWFGAAIPAGSGSNHRLTGAAVLVSATFPEPTSGALSAGEAIVDMSGPAAPYCAFSDTANVVLVCHPAPGVSNADFDAALHRVKLKAATYLARATAALTPPERQRYALDAVDPDLPRLVYIDQLHQQGLLAQTFFYGKHTQGLEPTVLHPNEMLDGALVNGNYRQPGRAITYGHTDNFVVRELYRRHGHDLNFLGVVIGRGWQDTQFLKERQGWMMARVARLMGAQVAIVTADVGGTGGNNTIDFMQTIKACEQMGLRTVAVLQEMGNPDGSDPTLVDYVPEADALVSVGGIGWHTPAAPAVERVIGGATVRPSIAQDPLDAAGPLEVECWYGAIAKRAELGLSAVDA
ncbi:MAG TPA: glycine/sarcosine/betaine reductase component B subunit [Alphaproteobacteria bacterium]|nr:glycine/sarcosine/betaine reductase component B subunit [Alphaproteobacteria bacterium]